MEELKNFDSSKGNAMNFVLGNCARYEKSETHNHINRKIPVRTGQFQLYFNYM